MAPWADYDPPPGAPSSSHPQGGSQDAAFTSGHTSAANHGQLRIPETQPASIAALHPRPRSPVTEQDIKYRDLVSKKVLPWTRHYIRETMNDPSKPIDRPIGPQVMEVINKFPELQEQWKTMAPSYYEALRTHEQWRELNSTPPTPANLAERDSIRSMVFPLILTEIDETMRDPSKPIETKIGPHIMGIINKFPELQEQWHTMSPAYVEALRIHEQWCLLFSTPPTLANPAVGLPADTSHGQSHVPSSPAHVPISAPTAPVSTQTGGTPSLNPVPPPNPVTPHDTVFPPLHPVGGLASSTNATKVRSATVLDIPLQKDLETPAAPAGSRVQHMPPLLPLNLGNKSRAKFKRPNLIAPELEVPGFWCAGKGGDHLAYKSRPGGVLATTAGPKSDGPDKKESRPDWLNLCQNEDPYICWKIFGTKAGCPHASDEPKCKYYHHMQQSILDTVVAKRGVNKEYIAWMIANYKRNVPASHQKELVVPTVQSAFAPPGYPY